MSGVPLQRRRFQLQYRHREMQCWSLQGGRRTSVHGPEREGRLAIALFEINYEAAHVCRAVSLTVSTLRAHVRCLILMPVIRLLNLFLRVLLAVQIRVRVHHGAGALLHF